MARLSAADCLAGVASTYHAIDLRLSRVIDNVLTFSRPITASSSLRASSRKPLCRPPWNPTLEFDAIIAFMTQDAATGGLTDWRRVLLRITRLLIGLALASFMPDLGLVAAGPCNSTLKKNADTGSGYPYTEQSDGRCEGRYAKDDAGIGRLLVASLVTNAFEFDPKSTTEVRLTWKAPKGKTLHISAYSLVHQTHYQMDIERPGDSGQYMWPMNVFSKMSLPSADLGIVAFYTEQFGTEPWTVYVPLTLEQPGAPTTSPYLVFIPPIELSKVATSIVRIAPDGTIGNVLLDGKPILRRYFPAEWPIPVELPIGGVLEGLYRVSISASISAGGTTSADFLVYLNPSQGNQRHASPSSRKGKAR